MQPWSTKDVVGGALFGATGLFFLLGGLSYRFGTPQNMGPGYLPTILGALLIAMSAAVVWHGIRGGGSSDIDTPRWRSAAAISLSVVLFGLGLRWLGLVPAIFLAVFVSSLADRDSRPTRTLLLAAFVALSAWLIFRLGLGLPTPAFRGFL